MLVKEAIAGRFAAENLIDIKEPKWMRSTNTCEFQSYFNVFLIYDDPVWWWLT